MDGLFTGFEEYTTRDEEHAEKHHGGQDFLIDRARCKHRVQRREHEHENANLSCRFAEELKQAI
jgi:hypothetical protein